MDSIPSNWLLPAVGAIIAALIAGLFSFFNLILSKEQKLSELRQNWINELRDDISMWIAGLYAMEYQNRFYKNYENMDNVEHYWMTTTKEIANQISISYTRILLRLNPNDKNEHQKELISLMRVVRDLSLDANYTVAIEYIPKIRECAQWVLKAEWERVKKGEPTFFWSKRITLLILAIVVVLLGYFTLQIPNHADTNKTESNVESVDKSSNKEKELSEKKGIAF